MQFAFPPPAPVGVPIAGRATFFPVHRIYCVGRNYVEHAQEMGGTGREAPFFFMKPADAVLPVAAGAVAEMRYPGQTADLQHEIELVVAIGRGGQDIAAADALQHVWGYAVGLDMTRRDLQQEAKKTGRPWCTGKGFDQSAPIAPIHPVAAAGRVAQAEIYLKVNGLPRQHSDTRKMIWTVSGNHCALVPLLRIAGRRPDLYRHPGRRRGGRSGRSAGGRHCRAGRIAPADRLAAG